MASHSSIPAWRIPWTEEPGGLQSMGSQRVRHDSATNSTVQYVVPNAGDTEEKQGQKTKQEPHQPYGPYFQEQRNRR